MNDLFDLSGKRALVTGASRGIGRALALGLARAGADVAVHYASSRTVGDEVAAEIRALGRRSVSIAKNLRDADCAQVIWEAVEEAFGAADILVLNASQQIARPWEQISAEEFDLQMDVNVRSSMLLIQKAVPAMRLSGWGRILTIGSVQERKPHPDMLVYSASKAAQTAMAQSLAVQLAPEGITVNNLAPGVILTDRNADAYADAAYRDKVTGMIPAGYWGMPEDCVGAALLLCSGAGRYITGHNLFVDGGKAL